MNLLQVDSSARDSSVSRRLTEKFVRVWKEANPEGHVTDRDLYRTPLPYITDDWSATFGDPSKITAAQKEYLSVSDALTQEVLAADIIVIGAPMYNFSISWPLKAWLDQIVRVGRTLEYGADGPRGLLGSKKVIILTSRGGSYPAGTPRSAFDFQEPYLRHILAFIGITDVTFLHAENQLNSEAEASRKAVEEQLAVLAGRLRAGRPAETVA